MAPGASVSGELGIAATELPGASLVATSMSFVNNDLAAHGLAVLDEWYVMSFAGQQLQIGELHAVRSRLCEPQV